MPYNKYNLRYLHAHVLFFALTYLNINFGTLITINGSASYKNYFVKTIL